jgi:dinuclear metal center YbgI/SA1388 family protein
MMELFKKEEAVITTADVSTAIENIAPAGLQEAWDNCGIMIGFKDAPVKKILTCLEINEAILDEAKELDVNMIITHHPLIFGGIKSLCTCNYKDRIIMELIRSGINVYSCHTPFDKVKGGNNDVIAEKLGLVSVKNLNGADVPSAAKMMERMDEADIGRIGEFRKPMLLKDVIKLVADNLGLSMRQIRVTGNLNTEISKVGICTGAGSDLMGMAAGQGCQLFVTGDVKYHEAQTALEEGICVIDAGHYGTEKFFGEEMKMKLQKELGKNVEIIASSVNIDPFEII